MRKHVKVEEPKEVHATGVGRVVKDMLMGPAGWQAGQIPEGFVICVEDIGVYSICNRCVLCKTTTCSYLCFKVTLVTKWKMDWKRTKRSMWSQSGAFSSKDMRDDGGLYETVVVRMEETNGFRTPSMDGIKIRDGLMWRGRSQG